MDEKTTKKRSIHVVCEHFEEVFRPNLAKIERSQLRAEQLQGLKRKRVIESDEISKNAGSCLQAAREAQGLSRAQVAERLRLRTSVVQAIETGNLEVGVPTTFVRGYIKNYVRLLHLPLGSVLPLLEKLQDDDYKTKVVRALDGHAVSINHFNWRRWLAITVLVLCGLSLFAYFR